MTVPVPPRILGIDPGSRATGYGVLERAGARMRFVACGVIRPPASLSLPERLLDIHQGVCEVIGEYGPAVMAVEEIFVSVNPMSALKLGHARGVILLAAMQHGLPVQSYSAKLVKQAVAGYGQAAKAQVQQVVRMLLNLSACPSQDAADALAVAMCHASHAGCLTGTMGSSPPR